MPPRGSIRWRPSCTSCFSDLIDQHGAPDGTPDFHTTEKVDAADKERSITVVVRWIANQFVFNLITAATDNRLEIKREDDDAPPSNPRRERLPPGLAEAQQNPSLCKHGARALRFT